MGPVWIEIRLSKLWCTVGPVWIDNYYLQAIWAVGPVWAGQYWRCRRYLDLVTLFMLTEFVTQSRINWIGNDSYSCFQNKPHSSSIFITVLTKSNKARDTRDLKRPKPLQRNLKGSPRNSNELQERNSEDLQRTLRNPMDLQGTPKNSKGTPKELLRNS